ncbi:MAG TPA: ester cyclase [Chitinophaga sp.]|uniref:ester cyclase n=1 Tax=Chitinophaga sp. TaxID=1869181 RepID=UPI002C4FD2F1|nr:ester cyclase [Chitinophaga sp.]HVI44993.1 ester cyclase [Chitinophaga sp.]
MTTTITPNKATVIRFNREVVEQGNLATFHELVAPDCINHSAPAGAPSGPDSMVYFLFHLFRKAFTDIKVIIHQQVEENDLVVTYKSFEAIHSGEFDGIPPSHEKVTIKVMDMIRLRNGRYVEHWGVTNLFEVVAAARAV